jgi:hypothetical protein
VKEKNKGKQLEAGSCNHLKDRDRRVQEKEIMLKNDIEMYHI